MGKNSYRQYLVIHKSKKNKNQSNMDIYWEKAARRFLRVLSAIILVFYVIWRICLPIIMGEIIHLDKNDGYIILGSIAMLICIEVWVSVLKRLGNYGKK